MPNTTMDTPRYASTERDTDLSGLRFASWDEVAPVFADDFVQPAWYSYGGRCRHAEAVFCPVRVLGCDYLLSAYLYDPVLPYERSHWVGSVNQRSSSHAVGQADTKDEAIDMLVTYARDVLTDEQAVLACLNATDLEFVRQAKEAGATICMMNNDSEQNKSIEIEVGNDKNS